jgi:superfamily II DNA or RNA helicase
MTGRRSAVRAVRLEFDRGTLLCTAWPPHFDPAQLPGMRWDGRVERYRAPARFHAVISQRLQLAQMPFEDAAVVRGPRLAPMAVPGLRPYQEAALMAWDLSGHAGVIVLPTGAGKTRVAIAAVARRRSSSLCLVPTIVLLHQWRAAFREQVSLETGCYGDGVRERRPVTLATHESAYRHMSELGNRFEFLIVDEAHHFGHGPRDEALEMCTAAQRLGLTATPPSGESAAGLEDLVGPVVYRRGIEDLAGTFLSDFEIIELRVMLTERERRAYLEARQRFSTVFDRFRDLAEGASWDAFVRWASRTAEGRGGLRAWQHTRRLLALTQRKSELVGHLLDRHREARTLVFTADKEAAYGIARDHLIMPITSDVTKREREAMLEAFRSGAIRALVSSRVLNEGFDVPEADVGIVVSGALGAREHVQRVGRLLRPRPGNELVTHETAEVAQAKRRRRGLGSAAAL